MDYILQGNNSCLKISDFEYFEEDNKIPVNILCNVSVICGNFSGSVEFDLSIEELGKFSVDLQSMYDSLQGEASLKETYGPSHIEIKALTGGHFEVSGNIIQSYPHQSLVFEFTVDQTMIKDFTKALFHDFSKYKK